MNKIGAVSPAARDNVSITPVRIPGRAVGKTTSLIVSNCVAPKAKVASRIETGMRFKASSVVVIMYGNDNKPKVSPAESTDVPKCKA